MSVCFHFPLHFLFVYSLVSLTVDLCKYIYIYVSYLQNSLAQICVVRRFYIHEKTQATPNLFEFAHHRTTRNTHDLGSGSVHNKKYTDLYRCVFGMCVFEHINWIGHYTHIHTYIYYLTICLVSGVWRQVLWGGWLHSIRRRRPTCDSQLVI